MHEQGLSSEPRAFYLDPRSQIQKNKYENWFEKLYRFTTFKVVCFIEA